MNRTNRACVYVKVSPALREYILAVNSGSDIIVPSRGSRLWGLVKMYLEPVPRDYEPMPADGDPNYIRIALYMTKRPVWSIPTGDIVTLNILYRDHLSEDGQRAVAKHLMGEFKSTFRAYMTGALSNNPELNIREAIDEFCSDYGIETENITVEMLLKDWYRFRQRCSESRWFPSENADL